MKIERFEASDDSELPALGLILYRGGIVVALGFSVFRVEFSRLEGERRWQVRQR